MPRRARIAFENTFYHIYNRGLNREKIFRAQADYKKFLRRLIELKSLKHYDHYVYSYVLMPNHFHLLLQVRRTPLSRIMSSLLTSYSMYFNKKYKRVGVVFQNRYKSKLCDKDSYFLGASRYILLNPVEGGLVDDPVKYPWSSLREILNLSNTGIIDRMEVKRLIGESDNEREEYRKFIYEGIKSLDEIKKEINDFNKDIEGKERFNSISQKKYLRRKKGLLKTI